MIWRDASGGFLEAGRESHPEIRDRPCRDAAGPTMHSQLREENLHPFGAFRLVQPRGRQKESEGQREMTTTRTCRFASCKLPGSRAMSCIAMRRTTCIVRQSSQRHVPVIAYSACNITKHHRGQTCKQRALPFTSCRHLPACYRDELTGPSRRGWTNGSRFI